MIATIPHIHPISAHHPTAVAMSNLNEHVYPARDSDTTTPVESWSPSPRPNTTRLDITAAILKDWNGDQKQEFIETLVERCNGKINSVLISGQKLQKVLSDEQIITIMKSLSKIDSITEFNCFHGKCNVLTTDLLAVSLPPKLQVLILWNFRTFSDNLIVAIRQQFTLSRISINFPFERRNQLKWGCFDIGVMALCCMENLRTLQIRCVLPDGARYIRQEECIVSPEAMVLLMNSSSIEHLYLENCGLLDDHMDEVCNELPNNKTLVSLNMKDNLFSDDCLYTIGRLLPIAPEQFESLDVTGVSISTAGGTVAAEGMLQNTTLLSLHIESSWASCDLLEDEDEEDDDETKNESKKNHSDELWMQQIQNQLRYNNAIHGNTRKSKQRKLMIASNAYIPPRQLVMDSRPKKKTLADIHSMGDVVSIVSENMSIVLKDVPSKASYVVSTISDNVTTFYQQQKQKQEELKTSTMGVPPVISLSMNTSNSNAKSGQQQKQKQEELKTSTMGIPPIISLSMNTSNSNAKSGSAFSCSYD